MINGIIRLAGALPKPIRSFIKSIYTSRCFLNSNCISAFWANALNFGDLLTPVLLKSYGVSAKFTERDKLYNRSLVSCGSILGWVPESFDGYVIGSGLMQEDEAKHLRRTCFLAVRGELTKKAMSLSNQVVLADPGLLACRLLPQGSIRRRWKLGIIPHQSEMNSSFVSQFFSSLKSRYPNQIKLISPRQMPNAVVRDIVACDFIASSSLHGIIFADSLHVPCVRVRFDRYIDDFKFLDYYSSIGVKPIDPLITKINMSIDTFGEHAMKINYDIIEEKKLQLNNCFERYLLAVKN